MAGFRFVTFIAAEVLAGAGQQEQRDRDEGHEGEDRVAVEVWAAAGVGGLVGCHGDRVVRLFLWSNKRFFKSVFC